MRYWWVNQNQTYRHEVRGGYLWSPKHKTNLAANPFYDFMGEVALGDVVFSFAGTPVRAIGIAASHAYDEPKPLEFGQAGAYWDKIGWRLDIPFSELRLPIKPSAQMEALKPLLPDRYAPLRVNSNTGGLSAPQTRLYAAITDPEQFGKLLRAIHAYNGNVITRAVLQLSPMFSQRPGQLRLAHWEDVDLAGALWRCPPQKMKLREWKKRDPRTPAHLVPLPTQAIDILRDLLPLTGPTGPIFRSMAKRSEATRYMSDNTINSALRTLGYDTKEEITGHGFRATARTLVRELLGWDREVIERHLAHVSDEELGGSYDRTTHLEQRRRMIQAWTNLLDDLAAGKLRVLSKDLRDPASMVL